MKKKIWILWLIIIILIMIILTTFFVSLMTDENKLTSEERKWIDDNISNIQNVYVSKDENIFSKDGTGVFYSFLKDFSDTYGIKINPIAVDEVSEAGTYLSTSHLYDASSKNFYTDHYVLVSKKEELINNIDYLSSKNIYVLNKDLELIKSYFSEYNINFIGVNTIEELVSHAINSNYIIIPRMKYIDTILNQNLNILYHVNDVKTYYSLNSYNDTFNNIINKYYNKWESNIEKEIKSEEFKLFTGALKLEETDIDKLLSIDYRYGFINNSPYEAIMSGTYGGIISSYINEFSEFSGVYFKIKKYRNINKLNEAINNNKVDIYFEFSNNLNSTYYRLLNGINTTLTIIAPKDSDKMFDSVMGLKNEIAFVEENSNLYEYLKSIDNIILVTYKDNKELFSLKDKIIVVDSYIYDYYKDKELSNYVSKYSEVIDSKYSFRINSKYDVLIKLFDKYINYLDPRTVIQEGINSHERIIYKGRVLTTIAKYFIITTLSTLLIGFFIYKKSKRIRIAKRIKKDDKVRFIDELTCLKNRAYLSDFIKTWNNNTIYPQTVIVIGLKNLQEINDKYGVEEGDKQIQACANALIKTQLDNSDLMRSDGNEFVIYCVGYSNKQIINYIHKLSRELKRLPYEYGVEFGYSIIENNLKTVEDALTEATQDMKNKKDGVK